MTAKGLPNQLRKENMNNAYNYNNISTATTTVVKTGAGILHSITVNTTTAFAITVYDNTSAAGTKIATIAASPAIGSTFIYDVSFSTGLTIVTAGASDITVSYK
jgi:bifunctional ADP-heptose synthase (sugar kinase/adenylyltransferase)